jgi:pumilio RNA-binding family
MNMPFAVPQFPGFAGTAPGQCVPPVAMPHVMVSHTTGGNVQYENRAEVNAKTPQKASFDFAEHVKAPSFPCAAADLVAQLGHPSQILQDSVVADQVVEALQDESCCAALISWLLPCVVGLSLNKLGTRVVQEALDHAATEHRSALIEGFRGHVMQLVDDFHGNHVLQKSLVVMSGASKTFKFIVEELATSGEDWLWLMKHKFGCRVAQRIVEHCTDEARQPIVDAIFANAGQCVTDDYANYVLQSILQHGTADQRYQIVCALVYLGIPSLSHYQIPATIVETALKECDERCKRMICQAILEWSGAIVRMACNRWGSCVVRRLIGVLGDGQQKLPKALQTEAMQQLLVGKEVLKRSKKHGRKFAQCAIDFFAAEAHAAAGGA